MPILCLNVVLITDPCSLPSFPDPSVCSYLFSEELPGAPDPIIRPLGLKLILWCLSPHLKSSKFRHLTFRVATKLPPHIPHFGSLPFASCQLPLTCPHPDFTFSHHQMPEPLQILALLCGSIFSQIVAPPILALPASNPASFLIDLSSWPCFDEKNASSCSVEVSDIASH